MTREERHTHPPEHETPARAIRVSVMDGADAGTSVVVFPDMRIHIGTEELSDLRVNDRTVSARHLAIDCVGHRFRITDLDSVHGTRLNDVSVEKAYIIAGDVISCGSVRFVVTTESTENEEEPPRSRIMEFDRAMGSHAPLGTHPPMASHPMESHPTGSHPPSDIKDLLAEWQAWAQVSSKSHRRAAVRLERRHYWLGVPSTLMGAVVGTTIFGTIERAATSLPLKIALALVSMTAAGLVALQTFFRYLERAGQHNLAHAEYDDIARSIELLSVDTKSRSDWVKSLEGLGHRLDAIKGKAPIPPDADDLEHEAEALKERFRLRLSASVVRRDRPHDPRSMTTRVIEARPSPPRLRRAPAIPSTEFFSGPLEPSRFYEEDERIAAWREARERARLDTERRVREVADARSFSSEERDGTSPDGARTTSAQRREVHHLEGGSFAAQLRAFEAVDN